ncbi:MAG: hypothetical protein K6E59_02430 [Bacilli bacterium]|nr:hypothetical protein [Bacilli bacterium]
MIYEQHHRGELSASAQRRYDLLLAGMQKGLSSITMPLPYDSSGAVVEAVWWDHPEIFYYATQYQISGDRNSTTYRFRFPLGKGQAGAIIKQIKAIFARDFDPMMRKSEYEKVLFVHDYIAARTTYDLNDPDSFTIIGPFLKGHAACQGVAYAAAFMLEYLNVRCFFVHGKLREGPFKSERHGWNAVQVEGKWAYMDITNDLDGMKSYFLVDEKTLLGGYSFGAPCVGNGLMARAMDFSCTDLEYHARFGLVFQSVEAAAASASHQLDTKGKAEVRLLLNDGFDHSREIFDAIEVSRDMRIHYQSNVLTQTYLFVAQP